MTTNAEKRMSVLDICRAGNYDRARDAAAEEGRRLAKEELEVILDLAVHDSNCYIVDRVLESLGRALTKAELDTMLEKRLASGCLGLATMSERWGRGLTQEEKDRVVLTGLRDHNDTAQVVRMVSQGEVSEAGIEALVDLCLSQGLPGTAIFLVGKIGRSFTEREFRICMGSCKRNGHDDRIPDVLLLPR